MRVLEQHQESSLAAPQRTRTPDSTPKQRELAPTQPGFGHSFGEVRVQAKNEDGGGTADGGAPDAAVPDAASPTPDAGTPVPDAGTPAPDAGSPAAASPAAGSGAAAPKVLRVEVENSAAAITYPVPSNAGAAGKQHWVTIAGARPDVVVRAVLDPAIPETDPQAAGLVWESNPAGSVGAGSGALHGTVSVPTAQKVNIRATLGGSSAEINLWAVFVQVSTAGPVMPPPTRTANSLGVHAPVQFTGAVFPRSIITDADRPDLAGANTVAPPGANICGTALSGGMDHKWDMSRQRRLHNLDPAGLIAAGATGPPACLDTEGVYPAAREVGNDDTTTTDENNDPYTHGAVITSHDNPSEPYLDAFGADGDTIEQHLQFQEFARLEFHGTIWNVSNFVPWRIHYRVRKVAGKWQDNGSDAAADNAGF